MAISFSAGAAIHRQTARHKKSWALSMEDYERAVYRVQWGYDDASVERIDSSLSQMIRQLQSSSGFEAEKCKIWIAYLEYLVSKSVPLTDEDQKILRNVSLKNMDDLERRISAIIK